MITYKDIQDANEGRDLLQEKRAEQSAMSILNDQMFSKEKEVIDLEEQANMAEKTVNDVDIVAKEAIAMMEQLDQQGKDPMIVLQQLPPEVQDRITAIFDGEEQGEVQPQQGIPPAEAFTPQQEQQPMSDLTTASQQLALS